MIDTGGILRDAWDFVLRSPRIPTRVAFASRSEREDYSSRILQRIDVDVGDYSILNIHRIGIDAPVGFVSEQLSTWGPRSLWWPNRLAELEASDRDLRHIRVYFLGRKKHFAGFEWPLFGLNVIPLFEMHAIEIHLAPGPSDFDNARYMLYRCSGGYPVGVVVAYVRSPIAARHESNAAQFFFGVGFDFYGRRDWPARHPVNFVWERIHNRVTANILNRFKRECETRFREQPLRLAELD